MHRKRYPQKLISFSENKADFDRIKQYMNEGWAIISLVQNNNYYVGIMEKIAVNDQSEDSPKIFIPARKKLKML